MTTLTFKDLVAKSWQDFITKEADLQTLITKKADPEEIFDLIHSIFPVNGIGFEFANKKDGKFELVFTTSGNISLLYSIAYIIKYMPPQIKDKWIISLGKAPGNFGLRMGDHTIDGGDVSLWYEKQDNYLNINLYCPALKELQAQDKGQYEHILYLMLEATLGEIVYHKFMGMVNFLTEPMEGDSITMDKLLPTLEELGFDINYPFDLDNLRYTGYQCKPNEDPNCPFRHDVYAGASGFYELLQFFFHDDDYYVTTFRDNHSLAGCLYYPVEGIPHDKILDIREEIFENILSLCGNEAVTYIGGATGVLHSYVDVLVWDVEAFTKAATQVFAKLDIPTAYLCEIVENPQKIALKHPPHRIIPRR